MIRMSKQDHHRLKIAAALRKMTISDLVSELVSSLPEVRSTQQPSAAAS